MSGVTLQLSLFLLLLGASGCHKPSTQSAAASNTEAQTVAIQPSANGTVADNLPPIVSEPPSGLATLPLKGRRQRS